MNRAVKVVFQACIYMVFVMLINYCVTTNSATMSIVVGAMFWEWITRHTFVKVDGDRK